MTIFSQSIYGVLSISVQIFPVFALFRFSMLETVIEIVKTQIHASMNITSCMFDVTKAGSQRHV